VNALSMTKHKHGHMPSFFEGSPEAVLLILEWYCY